MEQNNNGNQDGANNCPQDTPPPKRKRGLTSVTLQWIAERIRKAQKVKEDLNNGTYCVDSQKIAKALLGPDGAK